MLTWAARVEFLESILAVIGWASEEWREGRVGKRRREADGTVERRMLGDVVQALASTIWSHKRTHTKETGEGEEREEESSGVK